VKQGQNGGSGSPLLIITSIASLNVADVGATIAWHTNRPADSQVEYGVTTGYGNVMSMKTMDTDHQLNLVGLTPNSLYHYRVKSKDDAGNLSTSGDMTFTTAKSGSPTPTPPPSPSLPAISSFTASPGSIMSGQSSLLSWSVTGATSLRLDPGNVTVTGLTSRSVAPTTTTTYVLTATNSAGAVARSVTVTVTNAPPPPPLPAISSFTASPGSITSGQSSLLSWSVTGATGLRLDPGNVTVTGLTSRPVAPTATTTYVLTATNSAGAVARSVTVTVTGAPGPTPTPGPAPTPFPVGGVDEFVGPFPSWKNVKDYGAVGNGSADDTDALQKGLDALSSDAIGAIKTLYLPAGTYRITNTLKLHNTIYVNLIGEDPDNTIIRWDPPSGAPSAGPMLYIDAVAYSRYNRLTFDGQGKASIAVDQSKSDDPTPNFDTGNEYAEDVFKNVGYGIRAGAHGFGAAESSVVRCRFINNSIAGVAVKNYNALDWWIWYSYFENCALGVTNNAEKGDAGNFNVYYSVFKGSTTADMSIANTGGFAIRNNYSIGSKVFFYAADAGQNGALTIIQGNTILDTTDAASIYLGNYGPVEIYDNIIRSKAGASGPAIKFGVAVDALALGNTFTVSNQISPATRLIADNSNTLQPAAIVAAAPVIPFKYVPSTPKRQIFEVPADSTDAAIQQQINLAASSCGQRPVVHLPATVSGKGYIINKSLEVPAGCERSRSRRTTASPFRRA